jgi:protein TonB
LVSIETPQSFVQPVQPPRPFDPQSIAHVIPTDIGIPGGTAIGVGSIVSRDQLDNSPRTRFQVAPVYPFQAKSSGQNGEVMVEFVVDESGNVLNPRVVSSSDRAFEENTLRAVAKWKFEPGRRDGRTVRFRMSVPVVFKLGE